MPEKKKEVEFFLDNVDRRPIRTRLLKQVLEILGAEEDLTGKTTEQLKVELDVAVQNRKVTILDQQVKNLKEYMVCKNKR